MILLAKGIIFKILVVWRNDPYYEISIKCLNTNNR